MTAGSIVRYKKNPKPNARWTTATVHGINKDGSIDVVGPNGMRALRPERLERKSLTARKAIEWLPLTGPEN